LKKITIDMKKSIYQLVKPVYFNVYLADTSLFQSLALPTINIQLDDPTH
jgi:hypothetical protein